ncbi:hypothetical protein [Streptomyces lavendulae]
MTVSKGNNSGVPEPGPGEPTAEVQTAREVSFPPVQNGIDHLDDVADHPGLEQPSLRNLRYAVLHLQAAAEVPLKARLVQKHEAGDIDSRTTTRAVRRLRNIAGVAVTAAQVRDFLVAFAYDESLPALLVDEAGTAAVTAAA